MIKMLMMEYKKDFRSNMQEIRNEQQVVLSLSESNRFPHSIVMLMVMMLLPA